MASITTSSFSSSPFISDIGLLWVFQPLWFYGTAPKFFLCVYQTSSWQHGEDFWQNSLNFWRIQGSQMCFSSQSHGTDPWDKVDHSDLRAQYRHTHRSARMFQPQKKKKRLLGIWTELENHVQTTFCQAGLDWGRNRHEKFKPNHNMNPWTRFSYKADTDSRSSALKTL